MGKLSVQAPPREFPLDLIKALLDIQHSRIKLSRSTGQRRELLNIPYTFKKLWTVDMGSVGCDLCLSELFNSTTQVI